MNFLIIEDDDNKIKQICEFLLSKYPTALLTTRRSYQSGLKEIINHKPYDLIFLDMSMPTFDVTPNNSGGRFRTYAGRDILEEMGSIPVINKNGV